VKFKDYITEEPLMMDEIQRLLSCIITLPQNFDAAAGTPEQRNTLARTTQMQRKQ
jgi:hypothetical protein